MQNVNINVCECVDWMRWLFWNKFSCKSRFWLQLLFSVPLGNINERFLWAIDHNSSFACNAFQARVQLVCVYVYNRPVAGLDEDEVHAAKYHNVSQILRKILKMSFKRKIVIFPQCCFILADNFQLFKMFLKGKHRNGTELLLQHEIFRHDELLCQWVLDTW